MKRREFVTLLGGAAAAWPLAARAQADRMRRVGVLVSGTTTNDPEIPDRIAAFLQGMQQLGWTDGGNVRIDYRFAAGDRFHTYAEELLALVLRTLFWPRPPQAFKHYSGRPARCPSCSRSSAIRSPPASSKAWHGRVATPQACGVDGPLAASRCQSAGW